MISIYTKDLTESHCNNYCDGYLDKESGKHITGMVSWVRKRVLSMLSEEVINLRKNAPNRQLLVELATNLTELNIREILACEPAVLMAKSLEYAAYDINISYKDSSGIYFQTNILRYLFNYEGFRSFKSTYQNGYLLATNLSVKCCPYCNRNYTTQHEMLYYKKNISTHRTEAKYVFPEFDHFYSKKAFPAIAISFYNLIPSCNICNSHYKGDRDTMLFNLFHPYTKTINNYFNFKFIPANVNSLYGAGNNFTLDFEFRDSDAINTQIGRSIEFFGIKDNYEKNHTNLINEIVGKKLMFSNSYLKTIQDAYGIPFEESYRILFETYYEDDKQHQRPFSKLKRDIYDDINIK